MAKYKSEFKYGIKLQPDHFPVGTVFKVGLALKREETFTTTGIVYNTPGHFVVTTDSYDQVLNIYQGFSHTHITEILKRGSGPVLVNERERSMENSKKGDQKRLRELLSYTNVPVNQIRTSYFGHTPYEIVRNAFLRKAHSLHQRSQNAKGYIFDPEYAAMLLLNESFIKKHMCVDFTGFEHRLVSVPKKKMDRWFKQNFNRFLIKVETQRRIYDSMFDCDLEGDRED